MKNLLKYLQIELDSNGRVHEQEGASTLEFLFTLIVVLGMLLLVVQISLVFLNAILANHALSLASQEAAARGGVDPTVKQTLLSHLPGDASNERSLKGQCNDDLACPGSSIAEGRIVTGGQECTSRGQVFDLSFTYKQHLDLMRLFGDIEPITMTRTLKVASQSLNQPGTCQ